MTRSTCADPARSWAFEHYGFDDDPPTEPAATPSARGRHSQRRTGRVPVRMAALAVGVAVIVFGVSMGSAAPDSTPVEPGSSVHESGRVDE